MNNRTVKLPRWGILVILLVVMSFIAFMTAQPKKEYYIINPPELDITLFGDKDEYVLVAYSMDKENTGSAGVGKNYIATKYIKLRDDEEADDYQFEPDESYKITIYDIRKKDFPSKTIDIVKVLDKYDLSGKVSNGAVINYENKDYLWISIRDREDNDTEKFLDVESGELIDAPDIDLFSERYTPEESAFADAKQSTNLSNELTDNRNISAFYRKYYGTRFSRYLPDVPFTLEGTNFAHEYPDFAKALENDDNRVYARPGMVDVETFFNTVIHWAAPEGQEVLELYATNKETGEKTLIKSYADYLIWREENIKE